MSYLIVVIIKKWTFFSGLNFSISGAASRQLVVHPTAGVPGWACGHARQPSQTPSARGKPGIDVCSPVNTSQHQLDRIVSDTNSYW
jgi:hypothetical protein